MVNTNQNPLSKFGGVPEKKVYPVQGKKKEGGGKKKKDSDDADVDGEEMSDTKRQKRKAHQSISKLVYDMPVNLSINTIDPVSALRKHPLRKFDLHSFRDYFQHNGDAILICLLNENIITADWNIMRFPSVHQVKNILIQNFDIKGEAEDQKEKKLEDIAFEIVSFLINGLPRLDIVGSLNLTAFTNAFAKNAPVLLEKLLRAKILNELGGIIFVPSVGEMLAILGGDEDQLGLAKSIVVQLSDGAGQYYFDEKTAAPLREVIKKLRGR